MGKLLDTEWRQSSGTWGTGGNLEGGLFAEAGQVWWIGWKKRRQERRGEDAVCMPPLARCGWRREKLPFPP